MPDIPAMLAAYYADADPARLLIIADAMEEVGLEYRGESAGQWLREAWWANEGYEALAGGTLNWPGNRTYGRRELMKGIQNSFPIVERIICQYGCVICQTWHDEDDGPIFWEHIYRHGKHQEPQDKVCKGRWVWRNEPYWTRRPRPAVLEAAEKDIPF